MGQHWRLRTWIRKEWGPLGRATHHGAGALGRAAHARLPVGRGICGLVLMPYLGTSFSSFIPLLLPIVQMMELMELMEGLQGGQRWTGLDLRVEVDGASSWILGAGADSPGPPCLPSSHPRPCSVCPLYLPRFCFGVGSGLR